MDTSGAWFLQNRHHGQCYPAWQPKESRWKQQEYVEQLQMHVRPPTPNRHRTKPEDADPEQRTRQLLQAIDAEKEAQKRLGAHKPQPPWEQGHTPLPTSEESRRWTPPLVTTQVSTLNCAKLVTTCGTNLVVVTLSYKWCLDLHKDLRSLTLQSPGLKSLSIAVTDPDDGRWEPQRCLNLADADHLWFPSLQLLSLTALPMPTLRISGSSLPRLKHLTVSNTGFLLQRPPHSCLEIGPFTTLMILEVKEIAVKDEPMDLGALAACSPRLRTLAVSEFWGVGSVQPHTHSLRLPCCTTLFIRNSINVLSLDIWAPKVTQIFVLSLRLKAVHLGPGGPAHLAQHAMEKMKKSYPAARLTLLRKVLDEKAIIQLERHSQISDIQYDDDALEPMKAILESVIQELHVIIKSASVSCPSSPRPGVGHSKASHLPVRCRVQSARP